MSDEHFEEQADLLLCPHCLQQNRLEALYCGHCGTQINAARNGIWIEPHVIPQAFPLPEYQPDPYAGVGKGTKWLVLPFVAALAGYIITSSSGADEEWRVLMGWITIVTFCLPVGVMIVQALRVYLKKGDRQPFSAEQDE